MDFTAKMHQTIDSLAQGEGRALVTVAAFLGMLTITCYLMTQGALEAGKRARTRWRAYHTIGPLGHMILTIMAETKQPEKRHGHLECVYYGPVVSVLVHSRRDGAVYVGGNDKINDLLSTYEVVCIARKAHADLKKIKKSLQAAQEGDQKRDVLLAYLRTTRTEPRC